MSMMKLKCVKVGGDSLAYGSIAFAENDIIDLLDSGIDVRLYCSEYETALRVCEDPSYEIAQKIDAGDWVVYETETPLALPE